MKSASLVCVLSFFLASLACAEEPSGDWIWAAGQTPDQVFLRKTFDLNRSVKNATIVATSDNNFRLFVNEKAVAQGRDWQQPESVDVTKLLANGKNVLAVAAGNEGGIAAFMLELRITTEDGQTRKIMTDTSWLGNDKPGDGWMKVDFDAVGWKPVVSNGRFGDPSLPWTGNANPDVFESLMMDGDGSSYVPTIEKNVTTKDGFQVEKVFFVPRAMGSWVALATDDRGGLIASDQGDAGLFRIVPGRDGQPTGVTRIPVELSGAQGLLWAFDSLYAMVNGGSQSGLHRITDSDGDGELDHDDYLMHVPGGGEHGPHAITLSPDGKSLFVCAGNHTELPKEISGSRIPRNWGEDLLLPRRWDANGHAAGLLAPGGWICRVDPDGKNWDVYSSGFRNEYDIAFNADGELFSYDADMEWDLGSPWYRPTRVVHATSGSEFGWRSGTGKWPAYYEDSLPPAVNIGPGSPVGIVFGYGAKFPAKYQRALFILDWTYSTIYAVHLTPDGSTYLGEKEDFITGQPLQVTDAVIASDGDMYFAAGGRGTQSSLYRVSYVGKESVAPAELKSNPGSELRTLRRKLESQQGQEHASDLRSLDEIIASLGHSDRFIRYAARVALEARPIAAWRDKVLHLSVDRAIINGAIAMARQGLPADLDATLKSLGRINTSELGEPTMLGWLRAYELAFARLGQPTPEQRTAVLGVLDPLYPAASNSVNSELVQLLVYLDAPKVVERTLQVMDELGPEPIPDWGHLVDRHKGYGGTVGELLGNMTPARAIHYAFVLRNQKNGWTIDNRKRYFQFFIDAANHPGGNSYTKFLEQFRDDALATCSPEERVLLDSVASVSLVAKPPVVDPPKGPGREWTRDESLEYVSDLSKRNFDRGRNLFHAAQCAKCHRLGGEGGAIGPDLSTAGRKYPLPDLMDALIEPSKAISDQYGSHQVLTLDGEVFVGRLVRIDGKLYVYTADADKPPVVIKEDEVDEVRESKISQMPTGLINTLNVEELKDLVAYLLSGGNRNDRVYQ